MKLTLSHYAPPAAWAADASKWLNLLASLKAAIANAAHHLHDEPEDAREHFLSQATSHQDLEQRMRIWDEHERQVRLLPPAL